jgi:hypothetical protein
MKNQTQTVKDIPTFLLIVCLLMNIHVPSIFLAVKELPTANS